MSHRKAQVYINENLAGWLEETEQGYQFVYDNNFLKQEKAQAISLTFPLTTSAYTSSTLFSFFDGLIPEGWLLDVAEKTWKLNPRDRMGLLLACCRDCIGNVSIVAEDPPIMEIL